MRSLLSLLFFTLTLAVVPVSPATASVREVDGAEPPERWPQAIAQRPLSMPRRMTAVVVSAYQFRPSLSGSDRTFHTSSILGVAAAHGLTDEWQLSFSLPKVLCYAARDPSSCDEHNRWAGTGIDVTWAPFGAGRAQAAFTAGLGMAAGVARAWYVFLAAEGKFRPFPWLVLAPWGGISQGMDAVDQEYEFSDHLSLGGTVGVQPASPLYLWARTQLEMRDRAVIASGAGASWTFANRLDLGVWLQEVRVRAITPPSPIVPGWSFGASVTFLLE